MTGNDQNNIQKFISRVRSSRKTISFSFLRRRYFLLFSKDLVHKGWHFWIDTFRHGLRKNFPCGKENKIRKMAASVPEKGTQRLMRVTIPLCCDANIPITAKVLKKHKEMKEMDDELALKREEFSIRMRKVEKRKEEIRKKEKMLMKSLKEFEEFIEEKEMENNTFKSKLVKDKEVVTETDNELQRLNDEYEELKKKKAGLERCVEKYLPAYKFLESVANASVQFNSVDDIISYYDTLCRINKELAKQESEELEAIDRERENMIQYKTVKENQLLALSNKLIDLQQERETSLDKLLAAENHYRDVQESKRTRTMTTGQIIMAISSMYMTICNFEKAHPSHLNPVKQMQKVKEFIEDWSEVVAEAKKIEEKESGHHIGPQYNPI